jgi:hypothetical protein
LLWTRDCFWSFCCGGLSTSVHWVGSCDQTTCLLDQRVLEVEPNLCLEKSSEYHLHTQDFEIDALTGKY